MLIEIGRISEVIFSQDEGWPVGQLDKVTIMQSATQPRPPIRQAERSQEMTRYRNEFEIIPCLYGVNQALIISNTVL